MPGGRKRRLDSMVCPNPFHAGSHVKGNGTYRSTDGIRRNYRCMPNGAKPHDFAVVIAVADEDEPVPVYLPPPPVPAARNGRDRRARNGTYGTAGETVRRQRYRCWPDHAGPGLPEGLPQLHAAAGP